MIDQQKKPGEESSNFSQTLNSNLLVAGRDALERPVLEENKRWSSFFCHLCVLSRRFRDLNTVIINVLVGPPGEVMTKK